MSDLPTREEAEHAEEFDSALWVDEWEMAADLVKARAEGTLQTRQEVIDSLDKETLWRALPHKPETTDDFHHDPMTGVWFVPIEAVEIDAALGEQL